MKGVVGLFGPIGLGISGTYFVIDSTIGWDNAINGSDQNIRQNQLILSPGWSPFRTEGGLK